MAHSVRDSGIVRGFNVHGATANGRALGTARSFPG